MVQRWKHFKLDDMDLADMGNGFFGRNLVESDGFELTFVKGKQGAGHDFHRHEDLNEILVFLEGECDFCVEETDILIKNGSVLFIPNDLKHKVKYKSDCRVLRIKVPKRP
jgi:quercetin dioxygenase-like cupin family protein